MFQYSALPPRTGSSVESVAKLENGRLTAHLQDTGTRPPYCRKSRSPVEYWRNLVLLSMQNLSLPMNGKISISSIPSKSFFLFFPEKENPYACLAAGIFICPNFGVHRNFQTFPLILFSFCTFFCSRDLFFFILYACFFLLLFVFFSDNTL